MDSNELATNTYGRSTAAAVLAFKKKRSIINWSYETQVDNIVGKMTMAALDKEMLQWEKNSTFIVQSCACPRLQKHLPGLPT